MNIDSKELCMGCMSKIENDEDFCPNCGWQKQQQELSPHQLLPQTILNGKYLIGRVLGEGGFGITYLGWDLNLDMKVAIKEYYPAGFVTRETTTTTTITPFSGEKREAYVNGLDKFVGEAKSLAKFYSLPGIVSVKDFFKENGTAYIVMEYIEGVTLKEYLQKEGGKLPVYQVLEWVKPLIQSLSQMHNAGIIHRDISPDNIMITRNGDIKLLDFGAARDISVDGAKSLSVLLKPGYAPEEQYRTRGSQGPWTDVYALCATIYKVITGETPPEALERMHEDTLVPPSRQGAALSDSQERTLLKGMAILQKDRYDSIASLYSDLYGDNLGAAFSTKSETDKIKDSSVPSSDKVKTNDDRDKTVPLDNDNGRTIPLEKGTTPPSNTPEIHKSSRIAAIIILVLYSIGAILMQNYEAELILWAIAAIDIAYTVYSQFRKTPAGIIERLSNLGVRCSLVLFLTAIYLGDNSRAFGYGGDPDPGFAIGYGAAIVLIVLLLINAGHEAVKLIGWYKSTSVPLSKKRSVNMLRFSGIIAVALTFAIFALTLSSAVEDVIKIRHRREMTNNSVPEASAEPSTTPVSEATTQPTSSIEPITSATPTSPSETTSAPSEDPVSEGNKTLSDSPTKYPVGVYPANYSTFDYQTTRFTVFGDWLYYVAGTGELIRAQVNPDKIQNSERYTFVAGEGNPTEEIVLDGPVESFIISNDKTSTEDYIYFIEGSNRDSTFCRANLDGTGKKVIKEGNFVRGVIDQGWFYYSDLSDENKLCRTKLDGSKQEIIMDGQWSFILFVYDGWVYFFDENFTCYRVRSDGEYLAQFSSNSDRPCWVTAGYLYYLSSDNNLYRMRPDGSDKKMIAEGDKNYNFPAGDWIYRYSDSSAYRIRLDGSNKEALNFSYFSSFEDFCMCPSENHEIMYFFDMMGAGCYRISVN